MKQEGRRVLNPVLSYIDSPAAEQCTCLPLSKLHEAPWNVQEDGEDSGQITRLTPATQEMNRHLRAVLNDFFPRSTPLSLLLLHITQTASLPRAFQFPGTSACECASHHQD